MSGVLRALAKMGLVQLDGKELAQHPPSEDGTAGETDIEALLAETRAMMGEVEKGVTTPEASGPVEAPLPPMAVETLAAGQTLEALYAEANIQPSPFPAEKLLKLLEGLAAMDPPMRQAAVAAMDAADDAWTIQDPLLDASRKVRALSQARARLDQTLASAEAEAEGELAAQEQYAEQASATIREQIAELEATLAEELGKVGEERAKIQVRLEGARSGRSREAARLDAAIERLKGLYPVFGNPE